MGAEQLAARWPPDIAEMRLDALPHAAGGFHRYCNSLLHFKF
jgi:hypothetical protein